MIWIILACIFSSILYRAGGMSKEDTAKPTWMPKFMRNSWVRDWICPLVALIVIWGLYGLQLNHWWAYLLFWGLSGGALASYWGQDEKKYGFAWHGLGCGLAGIPLLWCGVPVWVILTRLLICTIGMSIWSEFIDDDIQEELGRGILFIL